LARAVYKAAVKPAGPEPRMITSSAGVLISGRGYRSRCLHLLRLWLWGRRRQLFRGHRGGVEAVGGHGLQVVDQATARGGAELADPGPHRNGVKRTDLDAEVAVHAEVVVDGKGGRAAGLALAGAGELDAAGGTDPGAGLAGGALELSGRLVGPQYVAVQRAQRLRPMLIGVLDGDSGGEEVAERHPHGAKDTCAAAEQV